MRLTLDRRRMFIVEEIDDGMVIVIRLLPVGSGSIDVRDTVSLVHASIAVGFALLMAFGWNLTRSPNCWFMKEWKSRKPGGISSSSSSGCLLLGVWSDRWRVLTVCWRSLLDDFLLAAVSLRLLNAGGMM